MSIKSITIDIERDVVSQISAHLIGEGFSSLSSLTNRKVILLYFNYYERLITPHARKIHKSKSFACPSIHAPGLAALEMKVKAGTDLKPHLSKKIKNLQYYDSLLNDWHIHHLHLGTTPCTRDPGFVERTEPLLYARFDEDNAYFIDIMDHNSWTNRDCVQIIHDNWPSTIASCKSRGAIDIEHDLTDEEIGKLREANINYHLKLNDGSIYAPIGYGSTMHGNSLLSSIRANSVHAKIIQMNKDLSVDAANRTIEAIPTFEGDISINVDFVNCNYIIHAKDDEITVQTNDLWGFVFS